MARDAFDLRENYEWVGTFWFPDHGDKISERYSGKATYTPEQGIRLTLISPTLTFDQFAKKLMYAQVHGNNGQMNISLINVALNTNHIAVATTFVGTASVLIGNEFVTSQRFDGMSFQYDDHLENIFLIPEKKERDSLQYARSEAINISNDLRISCDAYGLSTFLSLDDLDAMFMSTDEHDFSKFKEILRPLLEDRQLSLHKRLKTEFQIVFSMPNFDARKIMQNEYKWRLYWELIIDHPIKILKAFVRIQRKREDGRSYTQVLPCLYVPTVLDGHLNKAVDPRHLPINFRSFSSQSYNFKILEEPVKKWLDLSSSDEWQTVFDGIKHFIATNGPFADSTKYISLVADIETFLDLTGEDETNIKRLIELHSYPRWVASLRDLSVEIPPDEELGRWFSEIRNVIAHPKSCSKKEGGKYRGIVSQDLLLHQLYAHLAGLLMKAVLEHVGGLSKASLEEYTDKVIKKRCDYRAIEFKD